MVGITVLLTTELKVVEVGKNVVEVGKILVEVEKKRVEVGNEKELKGNTPVEVELEVAIKQ